MQEVVNCAKSYLWRHQAMLHKDCHYITFYSSLHLGPHLNLFKTFQILIIPFSFRANQQQNSWGILEELVQQQQKSKYFLHFVWFYVLFTHYNSIAIIWSERKSFILLLPMFAKLIHVIGQFQFGKWFSTIYLNKVI